MQYFFQYKAITTAENPNTYAPYSRETQESAAVIKRGNYGKNSDLYFQYNSKNHANIGPKYMLNRWLGIKERCFNESHVSYHRYGGADKLEPMLEVMYSSPEPFSYSIIAFLNFCACVELNCGRPQDSTESLDRINNNYGYRAGNLRWGSKWLQAMNRSNHTIRHFEPSRMRMPAFLTTSPSKSSNQVIRRFLIAAFTRPQNGKKQSKRQLRRTEFARRLLVSIMTPQAFEAGPQRMQSAFIQQSYHQHRVVPSKMMFQPKPKKHKHSRTQIRPIAGSPK